VANLSLIDDDLPAPDQLALWLEAGHCGGGTPWLSALDATALAEFALACGEGVRMMEAAAYSFREPPRDVGWEILGADAPGENWDDHKDPARAYALFRRKLAQAQAEGARLQYKLWFALP